MAISELNSGILQLALVELNDSLVLMDGCGLSIENLLWDGISGVRGLVTVEIEVRVLEQCFVARILPFNLSKLGLEWTRIDFDQGIALMNHLPLVVAYGHELSVHAAFYGNCLKRRHEPKRIDINSNVALARCYRTHR